jgi:hypothetical protein
MKRKKGWHSDGYVSWCKRDDRIGGSARKEIKVFAKGSRYITKYNVKRHLEGTISKLLIDYFYDKPAFLHQEPIKIPGRPRP